MDSEQLFDTLFPGFFEQEGVRSLPETYVFTELAMDLREPLPCTDPLPCPEEISFRAYQGPVETLRDAVRRVEEDWVQYFHQGGRYFCAFSGEKIAAFCILTDFGTAGSLRVGGPGCVGTVPDFRKRGIGLEMVRQATGILQREGFVLSWIHWTHLSDWYRKLGYKPVLTWNREGFVRVEKPPAPVRPDMQWVRERIRLVDSGKKRYLPLLLLADEQEDMIDRYLDRGTLYVLSDRGTPIAECVVTDEGDGVLEIKSLAVDPAFQGKGFGRAMIRYVEESYRDRYMILQAGTGDSPLTLPFYESCGFERHHAVKDFFTGHYDHPIVEGGKLLRDMIVLRKRIGAAGKEETP